MAASDISKRFGLPAGVSVAGVAAAAVVLLGLAYWTYSQFRIDVPARHIGVLIRQTGEDLPNEEEVATKDGQKGLQLTVLTEGRKFLNPYVWDWAVYPMVEIPEGKLGVRIRLYGDDPPAGSLIAEKETQRGVVPDVLRPGRYPINALVRGQEAGRPKKDYVEIVEVHDPVTVPAGFRGVVTNLSGPLPQDRNTITVESGFRGVQTKTIDAGTYYFNPYLYRVAKVDCRSQRYNLGEHDEMGFPSKDGFWVSLDGVIEFRIDPERAAEVFVLFNEAANDNPGEGTFQEEVIRKIVMPNARSFCRIRGSNSSGREFIGGETRAAFQKAFQDAMHAACDKEGVEIVQALITKIHPPQAIAEPVRAREVARQELSQYKEQQAQQIEEAKLATEKALIQQKQALVAADQEVVKVKTRALQEQQVAVTEAEQELEVSRRDLEAAKDQAAAMLARAKAEAGVIAFQNEAEAAGWRTAVDALGGDGNAYAKYVLMERLAPAFTRIMANSADTPLMTVFRDVVESNGDLTLPAGTAPAETAPISTPPTEAPDGPATPPAEASAAATNVN
jgi:hypothetical protein